MRRYLSRRIKLETKPSIARILDPLIFTLLDPAIQQESTTITVADVQLPILVYHQTFDQALIHHVLDDLLSLAKFGGQGFIRIAKGFHLKHTLDTKLRDRVRACTFSTPASFRSKLITSDRQPNSIILLIWRD